MTPCSHSPAQLTSLSDFFCFLVLRFFLEYQWLIDFALYAAGVFLFTEIYSTVVDTSKEVNIGAIWCVLTVLFSLYPLNLQSFCCCLAPIYIN